MQLCNIEGVCRTVYVIVKCGISLDIIWRCGQNSLQKLSCIVDCSTLYLIATSVILTRWLNSLCRKTFKNSLMIHDVLGPFGSVILLVTAVLGVRICKRF